VQALAQDLCGYARSERMQLGMCLEPTLALDYSQAHICLSRLGYPDPRFDALLAKCLQSQVRGARERPPHRVLEQRWLERTWGETRAEQWSTLGSLARRSALGRPMDLLSGSREDVYAFTHALMYAANFNHLPDPLPRRSSVILAEAEAALGRCLDEQDYDLGGEVLLAWPLTRVKWSAVAAFSFRVLARVEDRAGVLPSQATSVKRLSMLEDKQRSTYLLATAYHTAYVMGLLCAVSLQPGRAPPRRIPRGGFPSDSASKMLMLLGSDAVVLHWREELEALEPREQDALAQLLFHIALRRKVSLRDFEGARRVLAIGANLKLSRSPLAIQTAEMLQRLAEAAPMLVKGAQLRTMECEMAGG
jgi:hypothetical protein